MSLKEIVYVLIAHSSVAVIFLILKEFSVILFLILILTIKDYEF